MSKVIMICGKLCSGKSTYAEKLKKNGKAVLLSVDELMLDILEPRLGDMHDEYVRRTKGYLLKKSLEVLASEADVILDWGFWSRHERESVKGFYSEKNICTELHYINVSDNEWTQRITRRNALVEAGETSAYYVDEGLAEKFRSLFEEPDKNEIDVQVY
ncbi:MAG: ATP-binding protein [Oscillospiraceae bacterium]|nr:ATP-binding protein [Oscillospiraceae bacterium]